jgi:hypothetical protein
MKRVHNAILMAALAGTMLFYTSCGTLLYPERRGQTGGRIDPGVAVMDGVGLIFFLIPGIIAFAVDFGTGAIYLPPDKVNVQDMPGNLSGMTAIQVAKQELTQPYIERLVSERAGKTIDLSSPDVIATRIDDSHGL